MNLQPIYDIAEICAQRGITQAILSPGSRCAPITLAFVRHPEFTCRTISDERSAAFIGLGIAQKTQMPAVLVCTSGSAAYNYAPAVAEAYFQQIPLLIITADRPPEWIDQMDGQTIRQSDIYGKNIKKCFDLPADLSHEDARWHAYRLVSEAINLSHEFPKGPVHLNVSLREPFYPSPGEEISYIENVKITHRAESKPQLTDDTWNKLIANWKKFNRILVVGGQSDHHQDIYGPLEKLIVEQKIPVVGDIISNLHPVKDIIRHADVFIGQDKPGLHESLHPELLITFGKSTISKNIKLLLRKYKPMEHWHVQPSGYVADTYQSLTEILNIEPADFFSRLSSVKYEASFDNQKQENFFHIWQIEERKTRRLIEGFFPFEEWGEFEITSEVMKKLPKGSSLHLANSMAVRYANFIGIEDKSIEVFANRGTSGIDGSNSTTVGHCFASDHLNVLITGDLAFFYDRNAFWHNYDLPNLRIVLLNNHAGGIFRMISGANQLPELEEYFETKQALNARLTAEEFGFEYLSCDRKSKLKNYLIEFFEKSKNAKILEIETDSATNADILKQFKQNYKDLK